MKSGRRDFLTKLMAAGAAIPMRFNTWEAGAWLLESKLGPITMFTKPLDEFELEFMAETFAMAGLDGFDLSVRPGGRVVPDRVVDDLPMVVETGWKYNLSTPMMVTSIREANEETEKVLRTAVKCGVKHYRLGYYNYDYSKGIVETLKSIKNNLAPLIQLNEQTGIQAGYQNHSGTRVGAPMWDVWELIKDFPVEYLGSQFDIRHAVTEGAESWELALRLLGNNVGSVAVKDFIWKVVNGKAKVVSVPLGEGIVDFDHFFTLVHALGIAAPISLHIEYPLLESREENLKLLQKQKIIATKLKKDVDFIRMHLKRF